jgi:alkaline phosphatase
MNAAVASGKKKVLGLFTPSGKTIEFFRTDPSVLYPSEEPTLPEMTVAALNILEKDRQGFFLMVEGSQIDWAGHDNGLNYMVAETLAFDESVKVVLDWMKEDKDRAEDTLLIVVADHETGGMMIKLLSPPCLALYSPNRQSGFNTVLVKVFFLLPTFVL